ncbi:MAG: GldG family protein [Desulfomonilaceae bacterium]
MSNFLRSRTVKSGDLAFGTLIFIAIIVALQYIAVQNPIRWDITKTHKHTLAPQSKQIIGTFKEKKIPVSALAFYESKDQRAKEQTQDLLDRYRDVSKNFTYNFYDPDRDRAVALQNKIDSYPTLVLKAGDRIETLNSIDEESVTNALARLLRSDVKKVYFLKGHGELDPSDSGVQGFSVAREHIEKQNYKTGDLILLETPAVPEDATIVIVAGPKTDPMENEFKAIQDFINGGGSLLVMLNPFQTPKLCQFMTNYGFQMTDDIVVDRMSQALGGDYLMPVITTYAHFPITKNFTLASFFPQTRSVKTSSPNPSGIQAVELAKTSPVSWTINEQQLKSGVADFDAKTGQKGPVAVMSVSTITPNTKKPEQHVDPKSEASKDNNTNKEVKDSTVNSDSQRSAQSEGEKPLKKGRVVVSGSSLFAANRFFKLQGNADLFLNTISWLAEDENLIAIRPKSEKAQPIVLTSNQSLLSFLVPVVIMPLIWIVAGIAVFVYRRKPAKV